MAFQPKIPTAVRNGVVHSNFHPSVREMPPVAAKIPRITAPPKSFVGLADRGDRMTAAPVPPTSGY